MEFSLTAPPQLGGPLVGFHVSSLLLTPRIRIYPGAHEKLSDK